MSGRQAPSLASPPEDLAAFPVWHVHEGAALWRVTKREHGPWWFSSDGSGRFDLPSPRGTCYLADDPVVAVLEALGPVQRPGGAWFAERHLWELRLVAQCRAADATARPARGFGVTAELWTIVPFAVPQAWAAALAASGFEGLRTRARHDPAGGRTLALFGAAGERRRWRRGRPVGLEATDYERAVGAVRRPGLAGDFVLLD